MLKCDRPSGFRFRFRVMVRIWEYSQLSLIRISVRVRIREYSLLSLIRIRVRVMVRIREYSLLSMIRISVRERKYSHLIEYFLYNIPI